MDILFDPQFWIIQIVLMLIAGMFRAIPELLLWQARRKVRRHAEDMSEDEAARFWEQRDKEVREAPGRWLEVLVTYAFLRRARRSRNHAEPEPWVSGKEPAPQPEARRKGSARQPRTPLSSRLAHALTALGGEVIGGSDGPDYVRAWRAELSELANPVMRIAHALSDVLGAFRIRLGTRIAPRLSRAFAAPARIIGSALDTIAASEILTPLLVGFPAICALATAGYLIGRAPLAFSSAVGGIPTVAWAVESWRRRRLRKRRHASAGNDR